MTESEYDFRFEKDADGIATLTFDRPEQLNSLTFAIYGQLERRFRDLRTDDSVKVVVITGAGRGFCSGGSVDEIIGPLLETEVDGTLEFTRMTGAVVRNMLRLDKPILAAINGGRAPFRLLAPLVLHEGSAHLRDGEDYAAPVRAVLREGSALPGLAG